MNLKSSIVMFTSFKTKSFSSLRQDFGELSRAAQGSASGKDEKRQSFVVPPFFTAALRRRSQWV
jgi:hypothetical protein